MSSQNLQSFALVPDTIPEEWSDAKIQLSEYIRTFSNQINIRTVGFHLEQELLTGNVFPSGTTNARENRSVFRTTVNFGVLPAAGTKTVAHNIAFNAQFTLIQMWISATNPSTEAFSLQYGSDAAGDSIRLSMDPTNVIIRVNADYSRFTRSWVVIEYLKQE